MKKLLIAIMAILVLGTSVFAREYQDPMSADGDNYIICGDTQNDQVKVQFSLKYNLLFPFESGVYFGYSQRNYWRIFDTSSPFAETNYMPEVFYQFDSGKNMFGNAIIKYVDYFRLSPIKHKSNGRDGELSRSQNTFYGQIQMSAGVKYNVGANLKLFGYYEEEDSEGGINEYHKNYEADLFIKLKSTNVTYLDKEELHFKFSGNPMGKGNFVIELRARILTTNFQPKLFVQYYNGYDEFMYQYQKKTEALRVGVIF